MGCPPAAPLGLIIADGPGLAGSRWPSETRGAMHRSSRRRRSVRRNACRGVFAKHRGHDTRVCTYLTVPRYQSASSRLPVPTLFYPRSQRCPQQRVVRGRHGQDLTYFVVYILTNNRSFHALGLPRARRHLQPGIRRRAAIAGSWRVAGRRRVPNQVRQPYCSPVDETDSGSGSKWTARCRTPLTCTKTFDAHHR